MYSFVSSCGAAGVPGEAAGAVSRRVRAATISASSSLRDSGSMRLTARGCSSGVPAALDFDGDDEVEGEDIVGDALAGGVSSSSACSRAALRNPKNTEATTMMITAATIPMRVT